MKVAALLDKNVLARIILAFAIDSNIPRKLHAKGFIRAAKEDMGVIRIIKSSMKLVRQ